MTKITENDFDVAARLLRANKLPYHEAVICMKIMRSFLQDEEIPRYSLSRFRHIKNRCRMKGNLTSG